MTNLIANYKLQIYNLKSAISNLFDSSLKVLRPRKGLPLIKDISLYRREFRLGNGPRACLLIHGLGCGPIQMRELAERLALSGFTVRGILLPGHCEDTEALGAAHWQDWYNKVEKEYMALRQNFEHVSVVGFSIGGLLALKLSSHHPVDRMVSLAAPMFIISEHFPFNKLLGVTEKFFTKIKTIRRRWPIHSREIKGHLILPTVSHFPIATIKTLGELIRVTNMSLEDVRSPLLVVHSRKDLVAAPFSAFYIYHYAGSSEKKLVWLRHSNHLMMFGREKALLFKTVRSFLKADYKLEFS
ncbi:MAG TPA: alpha/beta hydrolase, partial [Candidatus Hypogeohydataceae bacterium YC41]